MWPDAREFLVLPQRHLRFIRVRADLHFSILFLVLRNLGRSRASVCAVQQLYYANTSVPRQNTSAASGWRTGMGGGRWTILFSILPTTGTTTKIPFFFPQFLNKFMYDILENNLVYIIKKKIVRLHKTRHLWSNDTIYSHVTSKQEQRTTIITYGIT